MTEDIQPPTSEKASPALPAEPKPKDKIPAPLLSRQKKEKQGARIVRNAPVSSAMPESSSTGKNTLSEISEDSEKPSSPALPSSRGRSRASTPVPQGFFARIAARFPFLMVAVGWLLVAAAIGALGYTTYMMYRETRLEGIVAAPSIDLAQVVVTRDFRAEALMLAKELAMSRAPLLSDIRQIEEAFARIRGDVAGRDERIRLLGQEVEELEKEVDTVIKEASAEARGLWETEGLAMNAEYEQKLTAFEQQLITRAEQLKVKFEPSKEYRVPEVWVNAFRLALYNAPPSVNTGAQRQWAEQQLGLWKEYCKIWDEKMAALKERIKKVQSSPKEKIDQITARRNDLRAQMAETEVEVGPLRREMEEQQQNLVRVKSEEASLEKTFYPQLIKTVDENRLFTVPFRPEDKTFSWRRIDRMPQFPPGKYFLWLKGYIDNEEYWSVVPFTLNSYSTTELVIYSGAFVKVSDILRSSINE